MYEYYETFFGIYDHTTAVNPLSSVALHPSENFTVDGLYDTYLRLYIMKDLKNKVGLSLDELLELPKYKINRILAIVDELDKKKGAVEETAYNDLKKVHKQTT
jgi:hypothetical protein